MEIVDKKSFDEADNLPEVSKPVNMVTSKELSEEEFVSLMNKMANPVEAQKELAVTLENYLKFKIEQEKVDRGYLSDSTRRWVSEYNTLLTNIHKALYGDKSVSVHEHFVSHSDISQKIREAKIISVGDD